MLHLQLIILLIKNNIFIDNETLLMTDFKILKIKSAQSIKLAQFFRSFYMNRMYLCVFIKINDYTYISICVYSIFLKKDNAVHRRFLQTQ
jgi:hypothetical protein